jgi:hypothetical protein
VPALRLELVGEQLVAHQDQQVHRMLEEKRFANASAKHEARRLAGARLA